MAFAAGWLLHRQTALMATIERQWALHFGAAAALTVACLWIVGVRPSGPAEALAVPIAVYAVLYAAAGWAWTLALLGVGLRSSRREPGAALCLTPPLIYLASAVVPLLQAAMKDLPLHWAVNFHSVDRGPGDPLRDLPLAGALHLHRRGAQRRQAPARRGPRGPGTARAASGSAPR
jgi:hypothetical protein